jgi:phage tail-like protein
MPLIGAPKTIYNKFKFRVEIDGITYAGFSKCSELSVEAAEIMHWEGGSLTPNKSPGRLTYAPVTLERGATNDLQTYTWFEQVAKASAGAGGTGLVDTQYKRNLEILQLDRDETVLQRWQLRGAWPSKFVAGDWDNGSDEKVITMLTLSFDNFAPMIRR